MQQAAHPSRGRWPGYVAATSGWTTSTNLCNQCRRDKDLSNPKACAACAKVNAPPCSKDARQKKRAIPPEESSASDDCIFELQEVDTNAPADQTQRPPQRCPLTRHCQRDPGTGSTTSAAPAKTSERTPRKPSRSGRLAQVVGASHRHSQ